MCCPVAGQRDGLLHPDGDLAFDGNKRKDPNNDYTSQ